MANGFQEGALQGGISFSMPSFGTTTPGVNSGYSFDLPLASVAAFQDRALSFTQNNSNAARGFLGSTIERSQNQVSQSVSDATRFQSQTFELFGNISSEVGKTVRGNRRGGCFITTAICKAEGKPDDCRELQLLRHFRDTVMASEIGKKRDVATYYKIAPEIVAAIDARDDSDEIYALLRVSYLDPAISAILRGDHEAAYATYKNMVQLAATFIESGVTNE